MPSFVSYADFENLTTKIQSAPPNPGKQIQDGKLKKKKQAYVLIVLVKFLEALQQEEEKPI